MIADCGFQIAAVNSIIRNLQSVILNFKIKTYANRH